MELTTIILAFIAYMLWRIYKQKENENERIANEKFDQEWEEKKKEEFKDFPNLIGKVDYTWLELFGKLYVEKNIPHLKVLFMMYLKESNNTKLDMEVDSLFYRLWDLTEELFEHLEKYHTSSKYEYEIAITTYWQNVAEQTDSFVGKDFETIKKLFQSAPFTDIEKISTWFPKKDTHPDKEISFRDENGVFPRESKGSEIVKAKLKELGL